MNPNNPLTKTLGGILGLTPPALCLRAWSRLLVDHDVSPEPSLGGAMHTIDTSSGKLTYYAAGRAEQRPIVLIHGIHAAASAADMRPLYDRLSATRYVVAPDLPGFGLSDRRAQPYRPEMFIRAIEELCDHVDQGDGVEVIALSLSCEYVARVEKARPELIHSIVMLSPTGFASPKEVRPIERDARMGRPHHLGLLRAAVGDQALYDLFVTGASIRYFLGQSSVRGADPELVRFARLTSHRPNARHAPLSFVSGALFPQGNPLESYASLRCPVLVIYDRDNYVGFGHLEGFARSHRKVELARLAPSRGLAHFERPNTVLEVVRNFWERAERTAARALGDRTSVVRVAGWFAR